MTIWLMWFRPLVCFDAEIIRPVVIEEQPELQPEFLKLQPEFKDWIDSGLEKKQQELQQEFNDVKPELQPESLYSENCSQAGCGKKGRDQ